MTGGIEVILPVRTWSELNLRTHWRQRARRVAGQREAARILVRAGLRGSPLRAGVRPRDQTLTVRLTRIAPRSLDSDNLAGALKAVRDGVADALGMDDGDARIAWAYAQRRGAPREYAVLVEFA